MANEKVRRAAEMKDTKYTHVDTGSGVDVRLLGKPRKIPGGYVVDVVCPHPVDEGREYSYVAVLTNLRPPVRTF